MTRTQTISRPGSLPAHSPMYLMGYEAGWADAANDLDMAEHREWPATAVVGYSDGFDAFITKPV